MIRRSKGFVALALSAALAGCTAASPTEEEFGDALRATLAEQRVAPQPSDEVTVDGDGQRLEGVIGIYRSSAGDPGSVVNTRSVDKKE